MRVRRWRDEGRLAQVAGRRLYVQQRDGGGDGRLMVFLHGFPSSSYDWRSLLELLPDRRSLLLDSSGSGSPRSRVTTSTR